MLQNKILDEIGKEPKEIKSKNYQIEADNLLLKAEISAFKDL